MTRMWPAGEAVEILGSEDEPGGFVWRSESHRIVGNHNRWRVHTRWWEPDQAVGREYRKVITDTGLLCLLYRDLLGGGWFLARVYD
jgi:hypothetical protein